MNISPQFSMLAQNVHRRQEWSQILLPSQSVVVEHFLLIMLAFGCWKNSELVIDDRSLNVIFNNNSGPPDPPSTIQDEPSVKALN